ncbi:MAG: glycosyltransferase, partial [Gammaproteobacteria bacterium]|nr:glycosyltransferase [Gammaproteobacteria bacterium]
MRIAILNRDGIGGGGATRAARRLRAGLRLRGHEALMVSPPQGHDPEGIAVEPAETDESHDPLASRANRLLQEGYIGPRRTALSNTLFSPEIAGYSFARCDALDAFDIINIHWVPGFIAPHNLESILGLGKPVVLTLHDMAAFTGGCHYSAGCGRYREDCSPCPQLEHDILQLARWTLGTKRRLLRHNNLFAVAPSSWLAACASASGLFQPGNVEAVPNGIETDIFAPHEKTAAKAALGIDPDVKTVLCGAENHREHRKGLDLFMAMLERLKDDPFVA